MPKYIYEWKPTQHGRRLFRRPRAAVPAAPPPAPTDDLSALKKDELVALASEQGVPTYGTKADIIERLEGSDGSSD